MTSKRVSAPFDLMKQLGSDDDEPKKQVDTTVQRPLPPRKAFTNGLFKPLSDKQVDMLEREYYTNKNMVGRDKLFFILKRKHADKAPTQKAINDWLINQKTHQLHRRQFQSQPITPIRNVRVPRAEAMRSDRPVFPMG